MLPSASDPGAGGRADYAHAEVSHVVGRTQDGRGPGEGTPGGLQGGKARVGGLVRPALPASKTSVGSNQCRSCLTPSQAPAAPSGDSTVPGRPFPGLASWPCRAHARTLHQTDSGSILFLGGLASGGQPDRRHPESSRPFSPDRGLARGERYASWPPGAPGRISPLGFSFSISSVATLLTRRHRCLAS